MTAKKATQHSGDQQRRHEEQPPDVQFGPGAQQSAAKLWTAILHVSRYVRHEDTWEVRITTGGLAAGWTPERIEQELGNDRSDQLSIEDGLILDGETVVARFTVSEGDEDEEDFSLELVEVEHDDEDEEYESQ